MVVDLDADLGDASEVYAVEPDAESDYVLVGEMFDGRLEDVSARWRVDEIYGGMVYFAGSWSGDGRRRASGSVKFEPGEARELGQALIRAAEYADRQRREYL